MIETVGLGRRFDGRVAVEDLNLRVEEGEVFGLLGPNGAGKTTTTRMLSCLIAPSTGTAFVNGYDIGKESDRGRIRALVGLLPESPGLYESLSAYRNLDFYARMYSMPADTRAARIEELLRMLDLWDRKDDAVATFSKGMKQKIAIARAFVHSPQVVFLDEPTAGLDPQASLTVREFLMQLSREGRTVFINSHHLDEVERLCDRIAIMNRTVLALGAPRELAKNYWDRTTVVQLRALEPRHLDIVTALPFAKNVRREENRILVDLDDPEGKNPALVAALAGAGADIEYVTELRRTLEDVYLKLVGRGGA
jgi:ABC-2 type transport system ATP-binding protein